MQGDDTMSNARRKELIYRNMGKISKILTDIKANNGQYKTPKVALVVALEEIQDSLYHIADALGELDKTVT